jgi:hypothetical protein
MGHEFEMKKPRDLSKINTNDLGELLWWAVHFGTTPEKLLSIINKVGTSVGEIKKSLK